MASAAKPLKGWRVFPLELLSLDGLKLQEISASAAADAPAAAPSAAAAAPETAPSAAAAPAAAVASFATVLPAQVKLANVRLLLSCSCKSPCKENELPTPRGR